MTALRCGWLCVLLFAGCGHARQPLPRPVPPFTPSPDADFRRTAPPELETVPPWQPPQAKVRVLANGMRIVVVERHDRPIVSVRYANSAAMVGTNEPVPGIALLAADALLESSLRYPYGGTSQPGSPLRPVVRAERDGTVIELDVLSPWSATAIQTIAELTRLPALDDHAVQAAARKRIETLHTSALNASTLIQLLAMRVLFGPKHPWAADDRALRERLERLTAADVRRYHSDRYGPEVSALVVVGDVSADGVFALAERVFGEWKPGGRKLPRQSIAGVEQRREVQAVLAGGLQTVLMVAQPVAGASHARAHALGVLASVVGGLWRSPANVTLRHHEGASYGVMGEFHVHRDGGYLLLMMAVDNEHVYRAGRMLRDELARLGRDGVNREELRAAKGAYLAKLDLASTAGLARALLQLELHELPPERLAQIEQAVDAVTADDIRAAARAYLDPDRSALVAIGDYTGTRRDLVRLGDDIIYMTLSDD